MRKAQKKDILDMIQTLHEAHEEIKNHIDRNNTISAQDLLAQCQECAVSIGNAIETMEKKIALPFPTYRIIVTLYIKSMKHCRTIQTAMPIKSTRI